MRSPTVRLTFVTLLALVLGLLPALVAQPVLAAPDVAPVLVGGNPTCSDSGYTYGVKWNYPEDSTGGTYALGTGAVTWSTDGTYVTWSSTFGVDAVIVKGGSNANVYKYDPPAESFGDDGLVSPNNPSGGPASLSHIEFCYDYEVEVSKTAHTSYDRDWAWTIDKSVDPTEVTVGDGEFATVGYMVKVNAVPTDTNFKVEGEITIHNPDPTHPAPITSVLDRLHVAEPPIDVMADCGVEISQASSYTLPAGETLTCTYEQALDGKVEGFDKAVVVTLQTSKVGGAQSEPVDLVWGDPTHETNKCADVSDDKYGPLGEVCATGDGPFTYTLDVYSKDLTCEDGPTYVNTATVTPKEGGAPASDDATVKVFCKLKVTKTAETSLTRTYSWTIEKVADQSELTLAVGQSYLVNYGVTVAATSADSDWMVAGTITIHNPSPNPATISGVEDVLTIGGVDTPATVNCDGTLPYDLAGKGTLECDYTQPLDGPHAGVNTAAARSATEGMVSGAGTRDFNFDAPTVMEVYECIDVTDNKGGFLGTVCAHAAPMSFAYALTVGPYDACGEYEFTNVASFTTNETGATGSATVTIPVHVPCGGCTLTQGYWKTHSEKGPAPYDDTWAILPNGADTPFFLSGMSWYAVFWTQPAGNAYYQLAHQYMAAYLNMLNGASSTAAVDAAMASAKTFFETYTSAQVAAMKPSSAVVKNAKAWASTLDQYNNGYIGPGHCSEAAASWLPDSAALFLPAVTR